MTVSSLNTYSFWEMAVARRPLPRMAVPVFVIKLGCDGSLSIISASRSVGGGGFEDDEAIVRLYIVRNLLMVPSGVQGRLRTTWDK
jgi:hypothetical protein